MCGCGRTSSALSPSIVTGPIWSKNTNGPTLRHSAAGKARRTWKPSPRSLTRGAMRVAIMLCGRISRPLTLRLQKDEKMPAYVLAEIEITNPEGYKEYTKAVPATIEKYGGRFIHRGGAVSVLEGEWPERRRVLIEFPTVEA